MSKDGVDITKLSSFKKINEIRLVDSTVKLSFGSSRDELKKIRPDLFIPVGVELEHHVHDENIKVQPLVGDDIYIKELDFKNYVKNLKDFWEEFHQALPK